MSVGEKIKKAKARFRHLLSEGRDLAAYRAEMSSDRLRWRRAVKDARPLMGICYIVTGEYKRFWEGFYSSFEKNFFPECEKRYFVFTDDPAFFAGMDNVLASYIPHLPWPYPTLLRFEAFLMREKELAECDYLMYANANLVCNKRVGASDMLPRAHKGEDMFYVRHPYYYPGWPTGTSDPDQLPYERRRCSRAFIPKGSGSAYVAGGVYGGTAEAFLSCVRELDRRIREDLCDGVIATWHDESHINRYFFEHGGRLLLPLYCFPEQLLDSIHLYPKSIIVLDKKNYIHLTR